MRGRLALVAILGVLASPEGAVAGSTLFAYASPAIEGRVVDAITRRPVAGASVLVYWQGAEAAPPFYFDAARVLEAVADDSGRFTIPAWQSSSLSSPVDAGGPRLFSIAPGHAAGGIELGRLASGAPVEVRLDLYRDTAKAAHDLARLATILGFLAASLTGDPSFAFLEALDVEWKRLPAEARHGHASLRPMYEFFVGEGRGALREWKRVR